MSRTHYHAKRYAPKQVAVNGTVFDEVKRLLFYTTTEASAGRYTGSYRIPVFIFLMI